MSLSDAALVKLEALAGAENFSAEWEEVAQFDIDGETPSAVVAPPSTEALVEIVRVAAEARLALVPVGEKTKLDFGGIPDRYDVAVRTAKLNRVLAYDPGDLTLSVEAGINLAELQKRLAENRQFLPLDPPFAPRGSIGGILAANSSGPLRHGFGTARDFTLGMEFISEEGSRAHSGGRVVKNVAGYDLHKLLIGALGSLGIIASVNFRTFPLPPASATLGASFLGRDGALAMRRAIADSPLQPRALEIVSPRMARLLNLPNVMAPGREFPEGQWSVMMAAAGHAEVVQRHTFDFRRLAETAGTAGWFNLEGTGETALWQRVAHAPYEMATISEADTVMKVTALPAEYAPLLDAIERAAEDQQMSAGMLLRGPGVVYVTLTPDESNEPAVPRLAAACRAVFEAAARAGGRALVERCPTELKRAVSIWGPPREDLALMQQLKRTFDPRTIFSPGRFVGGI
jgi:glycolate oxidase FAD binding subunit